MKKLETIISLGLIVCLSHVALSQQDNGNNFEMSWSADFDTFFGGQGKGLQAYGGFDLDKDGLKEFMVFDKFQGIGAYNAVKLFEAVGDNDFQLVWEQQYAKDPDDEGHGITVADLDEDGNEEVLVPAEDAIYIYEWDSTTFESGGGLPQEPTTVFYPITDNNGDALIRQLRVVDVDNDSVKELVMGYWGEAGMYMAIASLPNKDLVNPEWKDEFADDFTPWRMGGICIDDFDSDGHMEIFTSNFQDYPTTRLYESTGPDAYEVKFTTLPENLVLDPTFDDAFANPVFHDFDGDSNKEFVITDTHGKVWVITKEASNNFQDFGPSAWKFVLILPDVQMGGFVRSGFLGDLDRDGKADVYYNDFTAKCVLDLEYQSGPVTEASSWIPYQIYKGHKLVYGYIYPVDDLDGDGKGEIIIAGNGDPVANLQIIENQDAASSVPQKLDTVPLQFALHQNFPNPFNPSTQISYELAKSGRVLLEVYSTLGQRVATLVNEYQPAGVHQVRFDAQDLAAGIYVYRLSSGDFVQRKKMILIK